MRLVEFASAEEQLALWKLVSDSVWQSISVQAQQEQKQKAERARMAKPKRAVRAKLAVPKPKPIPIPIQPAKSGAAPIAKTQRSTTSTQPINTSIGSLGDQTAGS